jgi:ribokinase
LARTKRQADGKGGSQAAMAARAGARMQMIGRIGDDGFGARLRQNLANAGVDATEVAIDYGAGSGASAAIVQDDGGYGAVIVSGANLRISPHELEGQWRKLGGGHVLALQNEAPERRRATPQRLLDLVDLLVVNRLEAGMLTGGSATSRADALKAAECLIRFSAEDRIPFARNSLSSQAFRAIVSEAFARKPYQFVPACGDRDPGRRRRHRST